MAEMLERVMELETRFDTFEADLVGIRESGVKIEDRVGQVEVRLGKVEDRLGQVDVRLGQVEGRLDQVEVRLGQVEVRLDQVEVRLGQVEVRLDQVEVRLGRVEVHLGLLDARLGQVEVRMGRFEDALIRLDERIYAGFAEFRTTQRSDLRWILGGVGGSAVAVILAMFGMMFMRGPF